MAAPPFARGGYHLSRYANMLSGDYAFICGYYHVGRKLSYGARRARIREALWFQHKARTRVEDGEQLRRYLDALCGIDSDPGDCTYNKYEHLANMLEQPELFEFDFIEPKPKKGNSIMDKNLAALLRPDAKTLTVRYLVDGEAGTRKSKPYTYVSHLPLVKGDSVVVDTVGRAVIATVESVDDEAKIEPGSDIEYKWVIAKIDIAAHEANETRNAAIVAEAAVIVRENMRKSFASQVLGAASVEQRDRLLALTGNTAS